MICRLCLASVVDELAIKLYEGIELLESMLIKMIAKYFEIELNHNDSISTILCQSCCDHLQDFEYFCNSIQEKQNQLRSSFMECQKFDDAQQRSEAMAENALEANALLVDDESLMDIKFVPLNSLATEEQGIKLEDGVSPLSVANLHWYEDDENDNHLLTDCSANEEDDDDIPLSKLKPSKAVAVASHHSKKSLSIPRKRSNTSQTKRKKTKTKVSKNKQMDNKSDAEHKEQKEEPSEKSRLALYKEYDEIIANFMHLQCDICVQNSNDIAELNNYATFKELRAHFQQAHQREAYVQCCKTKFLKYCVLVEHIQWHQNPAIFECTLCHKKLRNSKSLKYHLEHRHNKKPEEQRDKQQFNCSLCNAILHSQKGLERHLNNHERKKNLPPPALECQICNKTFKSTGSLKKHIESIHDNVYHHVCDTCGKQFKNKACFDQHVQDHLGIVEPPMQCNICGKWRKNATSLRMHLFSHDRRDVKCKTCGKECISRTALRAHIRYAHKSPKILECKFCDRIFKETRNLEEHMAIHTGDQLYSCPHCSKECRSRSNMYVHIKRMHTQEWLKSKMERSCNPAMQPQSLLEPKSS